MQNPFQLQGDYRKDKYKKQPWLSSSMLKHCLNKTYEKCMHMCREMAEIINFLVNTCT